MFRILRVFKLAKSWPSLNYVLTTMANALANAKAKPKKDVSLAPAPWDKKKDVMDPVGKADADIDNDGDVDKSDNYLANRRKAISKNMKSEAKINELSPGKLGRYINKAADDAGDFQNSAKRKKGIAKATNKLVKKAGGKPEGGMFEKGGNEVEMNPNLKDPRKKK